MLHKYQRLDVNIIIFNIDLADDNGLRLKEAKTTQYILCTTSI